MISEIEAFCSELGVEFRRYRRGKEGEFTFFDELKILLEKGAGMVISVVGNCSDEVVEIWSSRGREEAIFLRNTTVENVKKTLIFAQKNPSFENLKTGIFP